MKFWEKHILKPAVIGRLETQTVAKMKSSNWGAAGAAIALITAFPACKMPPRQAWQEIRTEGLAHYLGLPAKEGQIGMGEHRFALLERMRETPAGQVPSLEGDFYLRSATVFDQPIGAVAQPVSGQPGMVYSPHAPDKLVDVSPFLPGDHVRCPHTGGLFYVPGHSGSVAVKRIPIEGQPGRERLTFEPGGDLAEPGLDVEPVPMPEPLVSTGSEPAVKPEGITAKAVPGRPNQVYSPYAAKHQIVDITGLQAGDRARCPYTERIFVVPGTGVVAQTPETGTTRPPTSMLTAPRPPKGGGDTNGDAKTPAQGGGGAGPDVPGRPGATEGPGAAADTTPTAEWSGQPGYVKSPFTGRLVNVRTKNAGAIVRCPFSGRQFKVPPGSN